MKCPACYHELTAQAVAGITVDICEGGCGGLWLDAFELQRLGRIEASATDAILQIGRDLTLRVDPARKRPCPRCDGVKLKRRYFSRKRLVEIDECPGCGGLWLDAGELAAIQRELGDARGLPSTPGPPPQLTTAVIHQIYYLHLES